ncbi:MAG TPA: hypothetical protein VG519_02720 [Pseudochrobactrum sp.]|nr:hypothetical protein [Pseudochrobactrum sp.]
METRQRKVKLFSTSQIPNNWLLDELVVVPFQREVDYITTYHRQREEAAATLKARQKEAQKAKLCKAITTKTKGRTGRSAEPLLKGPTRGPERVCSREVISIGRVKKKRTLYCREHYLSEVLKVPLSQAGNGKKRRPFKGSDIPLALMSLIQHDILRKLPIYTDLADCIKAMSEADPRSPIAQI